MLNTKNSGTHLTQICADEKSKTEKETPIPMYVMMNNASDTAGSTGPSGLRSCTNNQPCCIVYVLSAQCLRRIQGREIHEFSKSACASNFESKMFCL